MVSCKLFDRDTYNVIRLANGCSSHRNLPVPKHWNSVERPHVALVDTSNDRVFCFLLSQPTENNEEMRVKDLSSIQGTVVVEVKHSHSDYEVLSP